MPVISVLLLLLLVIPPYAVLTYYLAILLAALRAPRSHEDSPRGCRESSLDVVVPIRDEPFDVVTATVARNLESYRSAECLRGVTLLSDDSEEYAELLKKKLEPLGVVRIVRRREPRGGRTGALDDFFASSSSDYVLVVDVDGVVEPPSMASLCSRLCGDAAYVLPWKAYVSEKTRVAESAAFFTDLGSTILYRLRWRSGFFIFPVGSGTAFKREAVLSVGGWGDNVIQDDIWMGVKLALNGYKINLVEDGSVKVLVPSRLHSLRKQQTRWAYGTSEVLSRSLLALLKAKMPVRVKLEMIAYMMQPLQTLPTFLALLLAPLAALLEPAPMPTGAQLTLSLALLAPLTLIGALYGFLLRKLAPEVYEKGMYSYFVNLGRFSAMLVVLSPHLSYGALRGLLRVGLKWEVTPKGEKERRLPSEKTPHALAAFSSLGALVSATTGNLFALAVSLVFLVASAYCLLRVEL